MTSYPIIVTARPPRRIRHKPKAQQLSQVVVGRVVQPRADRQARDEAELLARAEAADRLWRDLVARVRGQ